jgi:protein O-GlcNAc transferase
MNDIAGRASSSPSQQRLVDATRLLQQGNAAGAVALCRQAVADAPDDRASWELLGVAASGAGDRATAFEAFHRLVRIEPTYVPGLVNLGAVLATMGRAGDAAERFRAALVLAPTHADAATFLVRVLSEANDLTAAQVAAETALKRQPGNAALRLEQAKLQARRGDRGRAVTSLQVLLTQDPANLAALLLLGRLLQQSGDFEAALDCARRAMAAAPGSATAASLAAEVLLERDQTDEAFAQVQAALCHEPRSADAQRALALVLQKRGDRDGAIRAFEAAVALAPQRADLLTALADAQARAHRRDESIQSLQRAVAADRNYSEARTRLFVELRDVCRWDEADALRPEIDRSVREALAAGIRPSEAPFIDVMLHEDLARNRAVARGWAREVERRVAGLKRPAWQVATHGPLTIGYLSDELRDHPIGHHLAGLFARHDRQRVRVHAYSFGRNDDSDWARRAREGADRFVEIGDLGDEAAAARIAADGVHILVDLKGYTSNARLEILALRPAPLQVSWLGFPGGYGGSFIDYALSDRIVTPPTFQPLFDEGLCCLPNTYQVNDDRLEIDAPLLERTPANRVAAGLPGQGFVFCCFNKSFKIPASLFDLWLGILAAVPGSCLWLWGRDPRAIEAMRARAATKGIDPARLVFAQRVPLPQHLRRIPLADLALDSMPYNGHATTANALWAGVPVLCVLGNHFASRVSASLLTAACLPDMVMPDVEAYRQRAIELAQQPALLGPLRDRLVAAQATAPFFDTARFVRNLETAYEAMWARHASGEKPATLQIEERP